MSTSSPSAASAAADAWQPRAVLRSLFDAALSAVDPLHCVAPHLPPRPRGRTLVLGAGKASARMARAVEAAWDGPLSGLVVTRYGHGEACQRIEVVESGHPVPDDAGMAAAQRMLQLAQGLGPDDLVLALVSGGGSSLITLPAEGLSMADLRQVNVALLRSGATISEMNTVRRHLSAIKGGRLAEACGAAAVHTLVVSDVPGDDPAVVASGPTVRDRSTAADALAVLQRHGLRVLPTVLDVLQRPALPAPAFAGPREVRVIATAERALDAAVAKAQRQGLSVINLGGALEGESREVARSQAAMARGLLAAGTRDGRPLLLLSGGETTVTVRGHGRGGRNSEFLLALALALQGEPHIHALACDTDGIDGVEDNAGGCIDPDSLHRAGTLGLHPQALLDDNDAYAFLSALGDLITTGPTRTNVNDFRALLIT
ncbi:MAG: glycerate kinase [Pseudomonadota bacterium]